MRIATTESVSLCMRMKSRPRFVELDRRFALDTKWAEDIWLRRRELKSEIQAKELHHVCRYSSLSF